MMKEIKSTAAPAAIGPYSQAIELGGLAFASGQLPIDPQSGLIVDGGIEQQTHQSLRNVQAILEAADTSLSKVVKTTVYLSSITDFACMNEVYAQYFQPPFPARSAVAVKDLPKGAKVEIEVVAAK